MKTIFASTMPEQPTEPNKHADISVLIIAKKAGYGLAKPKWLQTLEQIRALPVQETLDK